MELILQLRKILDNIHIKILIASNPTISKDKLDIALPINVPIKYANIIKDPHVNKTIVF